MKAQPIRLLDVFFIGPLMIWGGHRLTRTNRAAGAALVVFGGATISFNGGNYIAIGRRRG